MACHRREDGRLLTILHTYYNLCIGPLLLRDAIHACWDAIQPAVIDFPHAWAERTQDAATGAGWRHGHC